MKSPTPRLVAGLLFTLLVIGAHAGYTVYSVDRMRDVQTSIVDLNRRGSLQLIRIQNDLNALALSMRDMLDNADGYPLTAWKAPLSRIQQNLLDAVRSEAMAGGLRSPSRDYLESSLADFWRSADAMFELAARDEAKARQAVRTTLQPRHEALAAQTARLLVEKNDQESRGGAQVAEISAEIEANAYRFLAVSVLLLVLTGAGLIRSNRALFSQLASLAEQRRELARQLIATQESTFRSISRDLHDEFGQILTALGAMLRRADRMSPDSEFQQQLRETAAAVQDTLDKIRSLSQSLQPVILEEQGLLATIDWHLPNFERQTGIKVRYQGPAKLDVATGDAIHVFRILQEALNNVARHAGVDEVQVTLSETTLTVEDAGRGIPGNSRPGIGLAAMRERAELIGGHLNVERGKEGGTRVVLDLPVAKHADTAGA